MHLDYGDYEAGKARYKTGGDSGTDARPGTLTPIAWSHLSKLPKRRPLIKGLLDRGASSMIFGASGVGKTHFLLDLGVHIARGELWRGRKVQQGGVLYLAAEGGLGIAERLSAYSIHYGIDPVGVPLFVLPTAVDLCNSPVDTNAIIAAAAAAFGSISLELVIIDTVSRVLAGGNDNAPDDMGAFVANCDRLRQATEAHVAAVHHTGKDGDRRARGHSLLRAATDTEIEITKDAASGVITAKVTKQRDHSIGDAFASRLEVVELGTDEDGDPITSCVIVPANDETRCAKRQPKATGPAKVAFDLLRRAIGDAGEPAPTSSHVPPDVRVVKIDLWRRYCYEGSVTDSDKPEAQRKAFVRAVTKLQSLGVVGVWDKVAWLIQ